MRYELLTGDDAEEVREIELEAWRSTGCVVESEAAGVGATEGW